MGPCCVSTSSQSYPLWASCSATVGLCALRNRPILGCPARSCFLNSDPLSAASGMISSLESNGEFTACRRGDREWRVNFVQGVTGGQEMQVPHRRFAPVRNDRTFDDRLGLCCG